MPTLDILLFTVTFTDIPPATACILPEPSRITDETVMLAGPSDCPHVNGWPGTPEGPAITMPDGKKVTLPVVEPRLDVTE